MTVAARFLYPLLAVPLSLLSAVAASQDSPSLSVPVECEIGTTCIVQNYLDHDPGPSARDFRCGALTYDGHKGTDIRVSDAAAWRRGVAVTAAAPGRVRAVRDAMPDISMRVAGNEAIQGREAGNSVVIEHGNGWESQYSHLRRGSVAVRPGEPVERGRKVGLVGLSGNTEFPHLHFEVRHHGVPVDPYTGIGGAEPCQPGREPLWRSDAARILAYVATGVLGAGIMGAPPKMQNSTVIEDASEPFGPASRAAVFWVQIFGAREGDVEELKLIAPDGQVLARKRGRISRNLAQWLSHTGAPRGATAWAAGVYRGEYALYRGPGEDKLLSLTREIAITR